MLQLFSDANLLYLHENATTMKQRSGISRYVTCLWIYKITFVERLALTLPFFVHCSVSIYLCKNKYHYYSLRFTTHNTSLCVNFLVSLCSSLAHFVCIFSFISCCCPRPHSSRCLRTSHVFIYSLVRSLLQLRINAIFSSTSCMHHHHSPFIIVSVVPAVRRRPWTMAI